MRQTPGSSDIEPNFYQRFIRPFINVLSPEIAHDLAYNALHLIEHIPGGLRALQWMSAYTDQLRDTRLAVTVGPIQFESPIMLASGWEKKGFCIHGLHALGFSGVELGGVTLEPQYGNPKPRIFRLSSGVLINQCGFDSPGAAFIRRRLEHCKRNFPLGISLGKNKNVALNETPTHYARIIEILESCGDYFVINVSSPNTQGLRSLQSASKLVDIIQAIHCKKPLFIKIAPDLSFNALDEMISVAFKCGITGFIATNTTTDTNIKAEYGEKGQLSGGLSGANALYRKRATDFCRHIDEQSKGRLLLMGCGGVNSTDAALEKITAGASLVQIMTGFTEQGPGLANRIRRELLQFMEAQKISHILDCRGKIEYLECFRAWSQNRKTLGAGKKSNIFIP